MYCIKRILITLVCRIFFSHSNLYANTEHENNNLTPFVNKHVEYSLINNPRVKRNFLPIKSFYNKSQLEEINWANFYAELMDVRNVLIFRRKLMQKYKYFFLKAQKLKRRENIKKGIFCSKTNNQMKIVNSEIRWTMHYSKDKRRAIDHKIWAIDNIINKRRAIDNIMNKKRSIANIPNKRCTIDHITNKRRAVDNITNKRRAIDNIINRRWAIDQIDFERWTINNIKNKRWTIDKLRNKRRAVDNIINKICVSDSTTNETLTIDTIKLKKRAIDNTRNIRSSVDNAKNKRSTIDNAKNRRSTLYNTRNKRSTKDKTINKRTDIDNTRNKIWTIDNTRIRISTVDNAKNKRSTIDKSSNKRSTIENTPLEIKIAVMAPDNDLSFFSLKKVLPGIKMALFDKRGLAANIAGVNFVIIATIDTKCDSSAGAINAFRLIKKYGKIDFLIGPFCDYSLAPIARYSPYWNLPVVSPGGMSHDFGQEIKSQPDAEYPLLTRIGVTMDELAVMIEHLLKHYEWKKTSMLYDLNGQREVTKRFCHLAMAGLVHHFTRERFVYKHFKFDPDEDENDDDLEFPETEIREMLIRRVGHEHSIVILCASPEAIREIMIQAAMLNFTNGEYVFLNIDLFTSGNGSRIPWHRENDSYERNLIARKGFEALMTITLRKPDSLEYKKFSLEVKNRALQEYKKNIYGDEEVNSFIGFYYDAVLLYSLALNESLQLGIEPINGMDITRRMWNRTFEGITGMVSIDENGDRNADYYVMDMNPQTGIFETVATYYGKKKLYEPVLAAQIHWGDNILIPPSDTPKCGFDGSGCPLLEQVPTLSYIAIFLGALLLIISIAAIFIFRYYRLEAQLAEINWRVKWDDIMLSAPENKLENKHTKKKKVPTATLR